MLINIVASLGLASLMLVASTPIPANIQVKSQSSQDTAIDLSNHGNVRVLNCAQVRIPDVFAKSTSGEHPANASLGQRVRISIDASECDHDIVKSAEPWTLYIANTKDSKSKPTILAKLVNSRETEYGWDANHLPQDAVLTESSSSLADGTSALEVKYYIQVETSSQDGKTLLTGRSDPFAILDPTSHIAASGVSRDIGSSPQIVLVNDATAPEIAETVGTDVKATASPDNSNSHSNDVPQPHSPNIPKDTTEEKPSDLPSPSGPNQGKDGDPVPYVAPGPEGEKYKKPAAGETFAKYAGAGAAIFSTIGLGVGGLVGGVVGGTVGLVVGLIAATANSAFYK
ncbi:hypothetical protein BG004_004722 [Podila humilis]|nr:hypothetical protein BG004_004722 [Podila humilis]